MLQFLQQIIISRHFWDGHSILTKDKNFKKSDCLYIYSTFLFGGACLGAWSVYTFNVHGLHILHLFRLQLHIY